MNNKKNQNNKKKNMKKKKKEEVKLESLPEEILEMIVEWPTHERK